MGVSIEELKTLAQRIISQLSSPLSDEERAYGWHADLGKDWRESFEEFLHKLQRNEFQENQEKEINLTRELAWEGVVKGELADLISDFGRQWNNKYAKKPDWWYTNVKRRSDWPWW